jgi:hypothetical protein
VTAAALAPVAMLSALFPEGGCEPFAPRAFVETLLLVLVGLLALPRTERTLRLAFALYAVGVVVAYLVPTPVGGNVVRLGALCAGPMLALALVGRGRARLVVLLVLAVPLSMWQWSAAIADVGTAGNDPSTQARYYAPLLAALDRAASSGPDASLVGSRVEIPFTRLHWESRWVAPRHPLARGWERQLDIASNPRFYDGTLTAGRYRAWLRTNAVRWVAVPNTRLDYSAIAEARLVLRGLPYLREIWHDATWRLYAVRAPAGLLEGPARVTAVTGDTISLRAARPGRVALRVRWTPYWAVTAGNACVERAGAWTRLRVRAAGPVRLGIGFSIGRIGASSPRCASGR